MSGDPGTVFQALEQCAVQLACGPVIDIFHTGAGFAQIGRAQACLETSAVTGSALAIQHQPDPFDRVHLSTALTGQQLCEDFGHAVEFERAQGFMGGMCEHSVSPWAQWK